MTDQESESWLRAYHDPYASLYALPSCLCTGDLFSDGDHRLLVADLGTGSHGFKLKVFRGGRLQSEQTIVDLPSGLVAFYMGSSGPRASAVAVASGPCLYVYKNLRPFYKFSLPGVAPHAAEVDAWAIKDTVDVEALKEALEAARSHVGLPNLTARSQRFLMLDPDEREAFVQANRDFPLKKQTVVTALSTLKKSMAEEDSPSCLLLATEDGRVYVLEPDAFTILAAVQVASAPTFLDGQGLFDVDYHVAVACRDARLYIIKRGHKAAKLLAEPGAAAVGLCHLEGQLVVACTDDVLRAYSIKGQRLWSVPLSGQPLCVSPVCRPGVSLLAVALRGRTVALHRSGDGAAVDSLDTDDDVSAMRFGRLGREENALVLVGTGGGLTVLILKRGAQLQKEPVATPTPGPAKWSLPKKTKLFVDQTMREREHSVAMHRSFQRDLQRLRVTAARHYARALGSNLQPVSAPNQGHSLELSAQVQGLGPEYLLHLRLQNSRPGPVPTDLSVVIHSDPSLYKVARPILRVPYLVPGLVYRLSTHVSCLVESGLSDVLKVLVTRGGVPVVTALVQMPSTEA